MSTTLESLMAEVQRVADLVQGIRPSLAHMAEALAAYEQDRAQLRELLERQRDRTDELAECCLFLVEAVRAARTGEARALAELERLRSLVDESELRRSAQSHETPPKGRRITLTDDER